MAATSIEPAWLDTMGRLLLAAVLGGLIGWERGRADKPADVRTMLLISVGAAGFVLIGLRTVAEFPTGETVRTDPTRVLAYVISGVGFLGAGAILHSKKSVIGLTTASSVWCTAAVGAACGLAEYAIALGIAAVVLVTLWTPWVYNPKLNGNGNGSSENSDRPAGKLTDTRS